MAWKQRITALGFGLGLVLGAAQASASVTITSGGIDSSVGSEIGTVNYSSPSKSFNETTYIGRISLSGQNPAGVNATWQSFCVDLFTDLGPGTYQVQTVAAALNLSSTKISQLSALLQHAQTMVTDQTTSAAAQLAIWEILYDSSGNYNVTNGVFSVTGVSQNAIDYANTALQYVSNGTWTTSGTFDMAVLTSSGQQGQIVYGSQATALFAASAVPEPGSWLMMIVGFGAMGMVMRRGKTGETSLQI